MNNPLNKTIATLSLMCALLLPAAAQVQGKPLNSGATPRVVSSQTYTAYYGQTPRLNFQNTADTFYQVEVFSFDRASRMTLTDLGGRSRAYSDQTSRERSHRGRPVYKSSFSYNPQYGGNYNLRFSGSPGQKFTYRVTKWRLDSKPSGISVNRSRSQGRNGYGRRGRGGNTNGRGGRGGYQPGVLLPGGSSGSIYGI